MRLPGGAGLSALAIIADELKARDHDAWLACHYAPDARRSGLIALFALDAELRHVVTTTTEPLLGEIRLAWWRDRLGELDVGKAPAQPLLEALLAHAVPHVAGSDLAGLEDRWLCLLDKADDVPPAHLEGAAHLFSLAARLLGGSPDHGAAIGRHWALAEPLPARVPGPLRPLAGLAALAARDAARARAGRARQPPGHPARQLALLKAVALGR